MLTCLCSGALEPQFFASLLQGLDVKESSIPGSRKDKANWPFMKRLFTGKFLTKTRTEWEEIFDGTDACCTPVLTNEELEQKGHDLRPAVTLTSTPGLAIQQGNLHGCLEKGQGRGVDGNGWRSDGLVPGKGGEEVLKSWMGWRKGVEYREVGVGCELFDGKAKI